MGKKNLEAMAAEILATACMDAEVVELAAGGKKLNKTDREEMLSRLRAGEHVTLEVTARVFHQYKTPLPLPASMRAKANANFFRFRDQEMPALAKSFKGRPFLRDHDRYSLMAKGGKISDAQLEESSERFTFLQTFSVVKPWAVEGFLDGTIEAFSIAADPKKRGLDGLRESVFCTVCDGPFFSFDCPHFPGDEVEVKLDDRKVRVIVELQWRNMTGAETSAVTFPAVRGTSIDEVRAALSEMRGQLVEKPAPENRMTDEMKAALGLPSTATDEECIAAAAKLAAEKSQLETKLSDEAKKLADTEVKLEAQRVAAAKAEKERTEAEIARLREQAIAEGKITPNSDRDTLFAELAAESLDKAQRYVATLSQVAPVGLPLQSKSPAPAKGTPALSDSLKRLCESAGLSEEDFRKYDAMAQGA